MMNTHLHKIFLHTYVFTIVVPIIAIFAYIVFVSFDRKVMSYIMGGAGITLVVFGIIFWLFNSFLTKYIFNKYLLSISIRAKTDYMALLAISY